MECYDKLPKTNYDLIKQNPAYNQIAGKFPIEKASSYLYYNKNGVSQKLITAIKYKDNIAAGKWISTMMAKDMKQSGFFNDCDIICPVPLHWKKKKLRGFNQAEVIARSLSEIVNIPLNTNTLCRVKFNLSQTKKGAYERWKNTFGLFTVQDLTHLENKHILLVDDVLTTGATIEACAHALLKCKNIRISVLTLAIA
ncbi:ComF family protein [Bacteroidales bacterium OttesenSCG-928-M06]|nr:ComF family protein [Bacteroidales bacterium OttesenSCG-928-M06]